MGGNRGMKNIRLSEKVKKSHELVYCPEEWQISLIKELFEEECTIGEGVKVRSFLNTTVISSLSSVRIIMLKFEHRESISFQDAVEVLLHGEVLKVGDEVFSKDLDETSTILNIKFIDRGRVDILFESYDEFTFQVDELDDCFAWQDPYKLSDQWKIKLPVPLSYDPHWEEVKSLYTWCAIDRNGKITFFITKPRIYSDFFYWLYEGEDKYTLDYEIGNIRQDLLDENGICDKWKLSLKKRPQ